MLYVGLHRGLREVEPPPYLGVGEAVHQRAEDFHLSLGEVVAANVCGTGVDVIATADVARIG